MGSVYPCPDRSGTKLITNITHLPAVPVAVLQAGAPRPAALGADLGLALAVDQEGNAPHRAGHRQGPLCGGGPIE